MTDSNVPSTEPTTADTKPKYLRVIVETQRHGEKPDVVDVKVPLRLLKSGIKITALIPEIVQAKIQSHLQEKGLHWDIFKVREDNIDEFITVLAESTINVKDDRKHIKVYCE